MAVLTAAALAWKVSMGRPSLLNSTTVGMVVTWNCFRIGRTRSTFARAKVVEAVSAGSAAVAAISGAAALHAGHQVA
jgi:hypothetical protein